MTEGFYAHYPVAGRDAILDENGDRRISPEIAAWGAYILPDLRMMTAAGIVDVNEPGRKLPTFSAASIDKQKALVNGGGHLGLVGPTPTDSMVSIIAESRAGIPFKWFVHVIDKYYDDGLRFFVVAFDPVNASYGSADGVLFYSVPSDYEFDLDRVDGRSEHCVGVTVSDYLQFSSPSDFDYEEKIEDRAFVTFKKRYIDLSSRRRSLIRKEGTNEA